MGHTASAQLPRPLSVQRSAQMSAFVIKLTMEDADLLPPITAAAPDEAAAIQLVRSCKLADPKDKVECKGIRDDVMRLAFGDQPDGTVTIRSDWVWSGDTPTQKKQTEGGKPIDTAPRDGSEIMIFGRLSQASDTPKEWIRGRFIDTQGWYSGPNNALHQIYDPSLWKDV
jgi:hypothetical protein